MALSSRLINAEFSDSPYARELGIGVASLRFSADLELAYLAASLASVRSRVRIWYTLSSFLTLLTTAAVAFDPRMRPMFWLHAIGIMPCLLVLTVLAWSPRYKDWYAPCARLLVPLSGMMIAVFVANGMQDGQYQELAALTLTIMAVYFFSGLLYRPALIAALLIVMAFAGAVVELHWGGPAATRCLPMLILAVVIGAILCRATEQSTRINFLEDGLITELATRDSLSGLTNRGAFDEHLMRIWQQGQRDERTIAILMIDIDHFKHYNDRFGHQAGDVALRAVANKLKEFARRPLDIAARYGGEEFTLVLYDLQLPHVMDIAERLRAAIGDTPLQTTTEGRQVVTVSIGIAHIAPSVGRTTQGAIQLADEALYEAKQSGRNCIVSKGPEAYRDLTTGSFRAPSAEGELA